jgi:hypothetical protein
MYVLSQFLFRLAFGMAAAMAASSPRLVTSGYFRVHLYVILGLNTLAAMVAVASPEYALWPPVAGAILSYLGAVAWLYEKPLAGRLFLVLVSAVALAGAWRSLAVPPGESTLRTVLMWADPPTGGLVLGITMAAMLLGHWYLNTPTMQLGPLRRLIALLTLAVLLRMIVCGAGLTVLLASSEPVSFANGLFIALRWLSGLLGTLGLAWMGWQTLKIPNTQSATGILYVAVIATFLGELTSQLLSVELGLPL